MLVSLLVLLLRDFASMYLEFIIERVAQMRDVRDYT